MVVGTSKIFDALAKGDRLLLDSGEETVMIRPGADMEEAFEAKLLVSQKRRAKFAELKSEAPMTLDQIGDTFGVTRERIRQIESKTMAKLRHPSRSQSLRDYLE